LDFSDAAHHRIAVKVGAEITQCAGFAISKDDQLQARMPPAIIQVATLGNSKRFLISFRAAIRIKAQGQETASDVFRRLPVAFDLFKCVECPDLGWISGTGEHAGRRVIWGCRVIVAISDDSRECLNYLIYRGGLAYFSNIEKVELPI
jgi:hypothetical protein